jgi:hypothetical protein
MWRLNASDTQEGEQQVHSDPRLMIRLKKRPVLLDFPSQIETGRDGPRQTPTEMRP